MGQLKFEWIFENGQFVGRKVVMVDTTIDTEVAEVHSEEANYSKAS
jgi:hypothetical protein